MKKEIINGYEVEIRKVEGSGYVAKVPAMKNCYAEGDTISDAKEAIKEAIHSWVKHAPLFGFTVPDKISVEVKIKHSVTISGVKKQEGDMTLYAVKGILIHQEDLKNITNDQYDYIEDFLNIVYVDNAMDDDGHVVVGTILEESQKSIISPEWMVSPEVNNEDITLKLKKLGFTDKHLKILPISTYFVSYYSY